MTGDDAMVVSSGDDHEEVVPPWLRLIGSTAFYGPCKTHPSEKRNFYCKVCRVALCKECTRQHGSKHEMIRAYKVGKCPSFRLDELKWWWDITISVHTFSTIVSWPSCTKEETGLLAPTVRGALGNRRRQSLDAMSKYCSVECKVQAVTMSFRKRPRKQKNPQRGPFY